MTQPFSSRAPARQIAPSHHPQTQRHSRWRGLLRSASSACWRTWKMLKNSLSSAAITPERDAAGGCFDPLARLHPRAGATGFPRTLPDIQFNMGAERPGGGPDYDNVDCGAARRRDHRSVPYHAMSEICKSRPMPPPVIWNAWSPFSHPRELENTDHRRVGSVLTHR